MISLLAMGAYYTVAGLSMTVVSMISIRKSRKLGTQYMRERYNAQTVRNQLAFQKEADRKAAERISQERNAAALGTTLPSVQTTQTKKRKTAKKIEQMVTEPPKTIQPEEYFDEPRTE